MKQTWNELFDRLTPEELDILLADTEDAPELDELTLARIRAMVLDRAGLAEPKAKRRTFRAASRRMIAAAACLALVFTAGLGACAAEAKEYQSAVRFFQENGLSTDGLTRGEVKAVYRDITTNSFTYVKTAQVIEESITGSVGGYELFQDEPTPEDVANLWNYKNAGGLRAEDKGEYRCRSEYTMSKALGYEIHSKSYLEKYDGEELVWSAAFQFQLQGCQKVRDGVVVWGRTPYWSSQQIVYPWLAMVDEQGTVLWTIRVLNGFDDEYVAAVVDNGDGTFAVISRGDYEYLCLSQYSSDGERLSFTKTKTGRTYGIWGAARLGDGYLVQIGSYTDGEYATLVKLDHDGNRTDSFRYEAEDCWYYIADMIEFNGQVYLSAYAVPKTEDGDAGGRDEIAPVLNYLFGNHIREISSEELTALLRDNYTALLLVCDPSSGQPQVFYSVKGSLGGKLALDPASGLLWDVESIASSFFSPATSAFIIGGTCQVYRYAFDPRGALLSQEKTGETTPYYR